MKVAIDSSKICTGRQFFAVILTVAIGLLMSSPALAKPEILIPCQAAPSTTDCAPEAVEYLQSVVNNPANAGYRVILEPGTYRLTERLVLQQGMDLIGAQLWASMDENGVPEAVLAGTETVIDCSDIEYWLNVEVGRDNHIEGLTLTRSTPTFLASIIGSPGSQTVGFGWQFSISDCVVEGPVIAVQVGIMGHSHSGSTSDITLQRNIIMAGSVGVNVSFIGTLGDPPIPLENARINLMLTGNRISGANGNGLIIEAGTHSDNCNSNVTSIGNIYEDSNSGILLMGGTSLCYAAWLPDFWGAADENQLSFTSVDDIIRNNNLNGADIYGAIDRRFSDLCEQLGKPPTWADYNKVTVRFLGAEFSNNGEEEDPVNMTVQGQVWGTEQGYACPLNPLCEPGGSAVGNEVSVLIRNVTADGAFEASMDEANTVEFTGNPKAFRKANNLPDHIPIPGEEFFLPPTD